MPNPADPAAPSNFTRFAAAPTGEARWAEMLAVALDAIIIVDTRGHVLEFNPAAETTFGYTRTDALGREMAELIVPLAVRARYQADMARLAAGEPSPLLGKRIEITARHATGREFPVELAFTRIEGETADAPAVFAAYLRDISERSRREQVQAVVYRLSEAALEAPDLPALFARVHALTAELISAENFYVALLSPDRSLITFPRWVDEFSAPPPSRPPRNGLTEYVMQTARPLLASAADVRQLMAGTGYEPKDKGSEIWLGVPLMIGGQAIGMLAVQDYHNPNAYRPEDVPLLTFIGEQIAAAVRRHEAEDARRQAEARYRGIFEHAMEGLYVSTPAGRFVSANQELARLLGYDSPAALIAAINDISTQVYVDPSRREAFFALVESGREAISDFESEIYRRDGSRIWVCESVRLVRRADGVLERLEGVVIDVTQARLAAQALQAAKDAADDANRAKSQFLASMSHELRTPLNGVLGYTQILRRDPGLNARQRHGVDVIHQSAEHLLGLINDVLDLSKIEARRFEVETASIDLPACLQAVAEVFVPRAREKGLSFALEMAPSLPLRILGDEQRLRQVLFNLLSNAVKFTEQGGVVFSVAPGPAVGPEMAAGGGADVARAVTPGSSAVLRLRFSVSDTGTGIGAEDLGLVFQPFRQVGQARHQAAGTGLGLAISRSLVEAMGGALQVDSQLGHGSRFWCELPFTTVPETGAAPRPSGRLPVGYAGRRRHLLVVDDYPANRDVLRELVAGYGFHVMEAASGEAAVAAVATAVPDAVLMDLRMPGQGGVAAIQALRAAHGSALRIIGVSASAYDQDRRLCLEAGADAFVPKPVRETVLLDVLEQQLGLTWHFAPGPGPIPAITETRSPFDSFASAPPAAEAEAIFALAAQGDVVGLRSHVAALAEREPAQAPLAAAVLDLAGSFKMKAIRRLVAPFCRTTTPGASDSPEPHG